jgi:hypothetical protein
MVTSDDSPLVYTFVSGASGGRKSGPATQPGKAASTVAAANTAVLLAKGGISVVPSLYRIISILYTFNYITGRQGMH